MGDCPNFRGHRREAVVGENRDCPLYTPLRCCPLPTNNLMPKRSNYQDRVIRNYYQNQDAIMLQKLGDMVGDLYLAEGKAKDRLWKRVAAALKNLKIPDEHIQHLVISDNPALVANLLKKLLEKK
jgi:hypothetical protein